jgi:hypothetical protein
VESKNIDLIDVESIVVTRGWGEEVEGRDGERLINGYQVIVIQKQEVLVCYHTVVGLWITIYTV